MKLRIDRPHIEALVRAFPALARLEEQLHFGNQVEVALHQLSAAELGFLGELYRQGGPELQARAAQLATLSAALHDAGPRFTGDDLEQVLPAIIRYLAEEAIHGWMFTAQITGRPLPYVLTRLDFTPPSNDEAGKLFIELKANAKGSLTTQTVRLTAADIEGRTLGEIFAAKGLMKETSALIAAYERAKQNYLAWRAGYGAQFVGTGTGFYAEDPNASHRDTDWSRKDVVVLSSSGGSARLVNDEGILTARSLTLDAPGEVLAPYLSKAAKSNRFDAEDEVKALHERLPEGLFIRMPVHPFILMFHLDLHHYVWVHADDLAPYPYRPDLKTKLILPPEQTDLIDILTAEMDVLMDVLMDDIVAGKSGGTTVLCAGPPGAPGWVAVDASSRTYLDITAHGSGKH